MATICTCHPGVKDAHRVLPKGPESIADREHRRAREIDEMNRTEWIKAVTLSGAHVGFSVWDHDEGWLTITTVYHSEGNVGMQCLTLDGRSVPREFGHDRRVQVTKRRTVIDIPSPTPGNP